MSKKDPRSSFLDVDNFDQNGRINLDSVDSWKRVPSTRETLIDALAATTSAKHASEIVEALDSYLADPDDRAVGLVILAPDPGQEMRVLRRERDEAIARAEKAEQELAERDEEDT